MVLQRWQTVYLLISVIAMALAAAFPAVEPLRVAQPVVELGGAVLVARVLAAAIAVFLLVTITKFKNLKMQQMLPVPPQPKRQRFPSLPHLPLRRQQLFLLQKQHLHPKRIDAAANQCYTQS